MTEAASIHLGTCAWTFEDWHGVFYPARLAVGERLPFYAQWLDAVEVDSTFYHAPAPRVVQHWADVTPEHFRFSCKVPREITHDRKLRDCAEPLAAFLRAIEHLGQKLGCLLIQLPPWFVPHHDETALRDFVIHLPKGFRWAVEFRDEQWRFPRIAHLLEEHGIAWVWNDQTPLERAEEAAFEFHPRTADFVVLRLLGDFATKYQPDGSPLHKYRAVQWARPASLENWAAKVKLERAQPGPIYIFGNNHFEGYAPATVQRLGELLGIEVRLPSPEVVADHGTVEQQQLWP